MKFTPSISGPCEAEGTVYRYRIEKLNYNEYVMKVADAQGVLFTVRAERKGELKTWAQCFEANPYYSPYSDVPNRIQRTGTFVQNLGLRNPVTITPVDLSGRINL